MEEEWSGLVTGAVERSPRAADHREAATQYVPGLDDIPEPGDPLRLPMAAPAQPTLL
jgi:hypothetical protein